MFRVICIISALIFSTIIQTSANAQYSNIEQKTLKAAFKTLQWFQLLYAVSNKCNNFEYAALAPRTELASLVKSKLKVELEKIEVLAEENEHFISALYTQINQVDCKQIDIDGYLSHVYDQYDVEKFSFELFEPLSSPLITAREAASKNKELAEKYAKENSNEAETILVAHLIPREKASKQYLYLTRNDFDKPDYIYQIIKGWGKPLKNQFMKPPLFATLAMTEKENKKLMNENGQIKELIFINSKGAWLTVVIGSINLDLFPVDMSFLGTVEWKWNNNELLENLK